MRGKGSERVGYQSVTIVGEGDVVLKIVVRDQGYVMGIEVRLCAHVGEDVDRTLPLSYCVLSSLISIPCVPFLLSSLSLLPSFMSLQYAVGRT